jgi:hypothetical protein
MNQNMCNWFKSQRRRISGKLGKFKRRLLLHLCKELLFLQLNKYPKNVRHNSKVRFNFNLIWIFPLGKFPEYLEGFCLKALPLGPKKHGNTLTNIYVWADVCNWTGCVGSVNREDCPVLHHRSVILPPFCLPFSIWYLGFPDGRKRIENRSKSSVDVLRIFVRSGRN